MSGELIQIESADAPVIEISTEGPLLVIESNSYRPPVVIPGAGGGIYEGESLDDAGPEWVPPFIWYRPSTGEVSLVIDGPDGSGGYVTTYVDTY